MKPGIKFNITTQHSDDNNWLPDFPNPADFRFNYYKLLQASSSGLATLPENTSKSVAIVGAGCAGMTVARELHRCGFNVTIFEASDRIGGRLFTRDNPNGSSQAGMEMGAMRMPFFSEPGNENSILGYYLNYEEAQGDTNHAAFLTDFPDPGAAPGGHAGGRAGTGRAGPRSPGPGDRSSHPGSPGRPSRRRTDPARPPPGR